MTIIETIEDDTTQARPKCIAILQCSQRKSTVPCAAVDLYQGGLFKMSLAYAKRTCDDIRIISGKYGLVKPQPVARPVPDGGHPWSHRFNNKTGQTYSSKIRSAGRREFNDKLKQELYALRDHTLVYLCTNFYTTLGPPGERPSLPHELFQTADFL